MEFPACKMCGEEARVLYHLGRNTEPCDLLECRSCGFHFIDYLDRESDPSSPADRADVISSVEAGLEGNYERLASNLALLREHRTGGALLDVGCGAGAFLSAAAGHFDRAVGVEVDPGLCALARSRGLSVINARVEALTVEAVGRFDAITLWDVIEHLNDPVAAIDRLLSLLKPGGVLLLDTPSRDGALYRFGELSARVTGGRRTATMGMQYSATPFCHKQIFRKVDLRRLLARFRDVSIAERFELSFPTEYYARSLAKRDSARRAITAFANAALRVLPVRNKLIVTAIKA